tara:strand:- start:2912 stop:3370 length:459 start_codon:yes stop_codon:yes gene_type:complete
MATTLTTSTLKVLVKEEITLNGEQQGSETKLDISSVKNISKRLVSTSGTSETTIVSFAATPAGGTFVEGDIRYVRVTNLDDTNYVTLNIEGDSSTDFSVRLDPGSSYLLVSSSTTGVVDYGSISGGALQDLTRLKATANTAAVDLEVFVASV